MLVLRRQQLNFAPLLNWWVGNECSSMLLWYWCHLCRRFSGHDQCPTFRNTTQKRHKKSLNWLNIDSPKHRWQTFPTLYGRFRWRYRRSFDATVSCCRKQKIYRPLAYSAKRFTPAKRNHDTPEKETLALELSMECFRVFSLGRQEACFCDQRSVKWLLNQTKANKYLRYRARWAKMTLP